MVIIRYDDFNKALNEKKFQAKRKYTEKHPAEVYNTHAPIRNKVLEFIGSKGKVTKDEMNEFLSSLSEKEGKRPSRGWLRKNKSLVEKKTGKDGQVYYSLTRKGFRLYNAQTKLDN